MRPATGTPCPQGGREAAEKHAAQLAEGDAPSLRQVQREMHLGQPRAREVRSYLAALAESGSDAAICWPVRWLTATAI